MNLPRRILADVYLPAGGPGRFVRLRNTERVCRNLVPATTTVSWPPNNKTKNRSKHLPIEETFDPVSWVRWRSISDLPARPCKTKSINLFKELVCLVGALTLCETRKSA